MTATLAVLISGNGSNLQAIIDAVTAGGLPVADRGRCLQPQGRLRAGTGATREHPRPLPSAQALPRPPDRSRAQYDANLAALVSEYAPDWIVLAGWMHILGDHFLRRFPNRVVNLHPALPGQFPGAHAIDDALAAFARSEIDHTGVMVHLVPDERVDEGPALATETRSDSSRRHSRHPRRPHPRRRASTAGGYLAQADRGRQRLTTSH